MKAEAARICDRRFGIGGDGIIFALPSDNGNDFKMRIFNSDGSEPEMCGNGIRCLAKFVASSGGGTLKIDTLAGLIQPTVLVDGRVRVDMGPPILSPDQVPTTLAATQNGAVVRAPLEVLGRTYHVTCVSMGNPHAIIYTDESGDIKLDSIDIERVGPHFERHPSFPARINTEFVEVVARDHVRMVVWERGAGRTLACGTGACALVVGGVLEGRVDRRCRVDLPGGPLDIEWEEGSGHVVMTGPADEVYRGGITV